MSFWCHRCISAWIAQDARQTSRTVSTVTITCGTLYCWSRRLFWKEWWSHLCTGLILKHFATILYEKYLITVQHESTSPFSILENPKANEHGLDMYIDTNWNSQKISLKNPVIVFIIAFVWTENYSNSLYTRGKSYCKYQEILLLGVTLLIIKNIYILSHQTILESIQCDK